MDLRKLERRLNYQFGDASLLEQALTHKSFGSVNNERLEFLGDAVLGYVVAHELYVRYGHEAEDALTQMRANLVRKESLHQVALELNLGEYLQLGVGERKSGGSQRASILADALEAIIGAVRLDGGVEPATNLVLALFEERIAEAATEEFKDAKTRLQELLQSQKLELPVYAVTQTSGSDHRRSFTVSCEVAQRGLVTSGEGRSRRDAEKAAASEMLNQLVQAADSI